MKVKTIHSLVINHLKSYSLLYLINNLKNCIKVKKFTAWVLVNTLIIILSFQNSIEFFQP